MEAEIRVSDALQASDDQGLPKTTRSQEKGRKYSSPIASGERMALLTTWFCIYGLQSGETIHF